tara:strand:- start:68 stop:1792 length:1725 start_codon:yes stop_codon:yes gene_type:complete
VVDFTREIKQAQKTASQTPKLEAPTNSLGGDILNAVGTGLQFYQQQQAKTELQDLTQREAEYNKKLSQGVLGLRELRQDLVNQGISRSDLLVREKSYLEKYAPEMQFEIVGGVKKITGETLSTFSDEITAKQKEKDQAVAQAQKDLFALQDSVAAYAAASGSSVADIENMSQKELRDAQLQGVIDNSKREAEKLELAKKIQDGTYNNMTEKQQTAEYIQVALPAFRNTVSSELFTNIDALGGFGSLMEGKNKKLVLDDIQKQRRSIPDLLAVQMQEATKQGVSLSQSQQQAFRTEAEAELTRVEAYISDEKYIKIFDSMNNKLLREGLYKMATTGNPTERGAAQTAILMLGANISFGSMEQSSAIKTLNNFYKKQVVLDDDEDGTARSKVQLVNSSLGANLDGEWTPEQQENNWVATEPLISGTPEQVSTYAKSGGFDGLAAQIANAEGKNFDTKDQAALADALFEQSYKRVSASQMAAINTKSSRLVSSGSGRASERTYVSTDVLKDFTLNPETALLEQLSDTYVYPDAVKRYNKYMKDLLKSFEILGVEKVMVKDFKENAMKSFMVLREDNK